MNQDIAQLWSLACECDSSCAREVEQKLLLQTSSIAAKIGASLATLYPALQSVVFKYACAFEAIAQDGWREARSRDQYVSLFQKACTTLTQTNDEVQVRCGLRHVTAVERMRIALRELNSYIDNRTTAHEWASLAEAQLEISVTFALAWAQTQGATAELNHSFVVLGLGKLGGYELNAGSDIDIMFVYELNEIFLNSTQVSLVTKVAQKIVSLLEEPDENGFCARVDLRLRPYGQSGPLVHSTGALIGYYEALGRTWERAMFIRARPVAGCLDLGENILRELRPFVYRKIVDPSIAIEMKHMLLNARAAVLHESDYNLKLGVGGIREAEFFVQTLQLIWGGKEPRVRSTNTIEGITKLRAYGYVTKRELQDLTNGYLFLRRLEHYVQLRSGLQTHCLPTVETELDQIAKVIGYASSQQLLQKLKSVHEKISALFSSLLQTTKVHVLPCQYAYRDELWFVLDTTKTTVAEETKLHVSTELIACLKSLALQPDAPLSAQMRERYPHSATTLINSILDAASPECAANLIGSFFSRLSSPATESYLRVFNQEPRALSRFVNLCGSSLYLGTLLVGHPELMDRILFPNRPLNVGRGEARQLVIDEIAHLAADHRSEIEHQVGALRRAKSIFELEVGLADLAQEIELEEISLLLSEIADVTLYYALIWAFNECFVRYFPKQLDEDEDLLPTCGLAIFAMGKLGSCEISYGSDLDIVFVYDSHVFSQWNNPRIEASEFYARVATRTLRFLSVPHPDGPGYELDTRLRPSGEQGLLVVSVDSFRNYYLEQLSHQIHAAQWERQALIKLRPCVGDSSVQSQVLEIATLAAYKKTLPELSEIRRFRTRFERELARESNGRYDIKWGYGGLIEIEFIIQSLQMRYGASHQEVCVPGTLKAIHALEAVNVLTTSAASTLRENYRFLRRLEHRLRIVHGTRSTRIDEQAIGLTLVARSVGFRDDSDSLVREQLFAHYQRVTHENRALFDHYLPNE